MLSIAHFPIVLINDRDLHDIIVVIHQVERDSIYFIILNTYYTYIGYIKYIYRNIHDFI